MTMPQPTQVQYPWRSTARTGFQVLVAGAAVWGLAIEAAGVDQANTVIAVTVTAAAGVNRVMALPAVNDFIARFVPWLAAEPRQ